MRGHKPRADHVRYARKRRVRGRRLTDTHHGNETMREASHEDAASSQGQTYRCTRCVGLADDEVSFVDAPHCDRPMGTPWMTSNEKQRRREGEAQGW